MACGKGFTFADDLENDPVLLELSTPDPDVATASVYIGTPDGLLYGLAGTSLIEADTIYSFAWDGAVRAMDTTEGSQAVFAPPWSLSYAVDGAASTPAFAIPGASHEMPAQVHCLHKAIIHVAFCSLWPKRNVRYSHKATICVIICRHWTCLLPATL